MSAPFYTGESWVSRARQASPGWDKASLHYCPVSCAPCRAHSLTAAPEAGYGDPPGPCSLRPWPSLWSWLWAHLQAQLTLHPWYRSSSPGCAQTRSGILTGSCCLPSLCQGHWAAGLAARCFPFGIFQ